MTQLLTIGVIGSSLKENEKRVAIYPEHIKRISHRLRKQMTFEKGYGLRFGMEDNTLAELTSGRVAPRKEILKGFDCVLIPKPMVKDLSQVREHTIIWGWPHCVEKKEITQIAIERKLTLIAWESMYIWSKTSVKKMHVFYKNNEMAGYAGVNHALSLIGVNGNYGKQRKVAVLSFGSVSRGAIYALQGQGFQDITVYTSRPSTEVRQQAPGILFKQIENDGLGNMSVIEVDGTTHPLVEALSDKQIIINGTLQDVDNPKTFVNTAESNKLMKGTLIIDISCDEGMGFWCAKPTTFEHPIFKVAGKFYYSVDHSPSYYWDSATWVISEALIPFLSKVIGGQKVWENSKTISKAIEIRNGVIQNPKILSFQNREKEYPHLFR